MGIETMSRSWIATACALVARLVPGRLLKRGLKLRRAGWIAPNLAEAGTLVAAFDRDKLARVGPGRVVITRDSYAEWVDALYKDKEFDAQRWFHALHRALRSCPAWTRGLPVDCDYNAVDDTITIDVLRVNAPESKQGRSCSVENQSK
jgi:hypothetical protein